RAGDRRRDGLDAGGRALRPARALSPPRSARTPARRRGDRPGHRGRRGPVMRGAVVSSLVLAIVAASPVAAQELETVSLERAIELVRERSPASRALRAQVHVADADTELAGVYPNPELGYVFMGRFDGTNQAING